MGVASLLGPGRMGTPGCPGRRAGAGVFVCCSLRDAGSGIWPAVAVSGARWVGVPRWRGWLRLGWAWSRASLGFAVEAGVGCPPPDAAGLVGETDAVHAVGAGFGYRDELGVGIHGFGQVPVGGGAGDEEPTGVRQIYTCSGASLISGRRARGIVTSHRPRANAPPEPWLIRERDSSPQCQKKVGGRLWPSPNLSVDLRREFENPCPPLKTVALRRSRGFYKQDRRSSGPTVADSRGRMVRSLEMAQPLLHPEQVDDLVAEYRSGATLVELAARFGVSRRTVAAHLVRREVPILRAW